MSDKPSNKVQSGDLVFAAIFLVFSVFLLSQLPNQVLWLKKVKLVAQPGFWPAASLIGMVGFGLAHFLSRLRLSDFRREGSEMAVWAKSLEFAVWFMAYVVVVPVVGYLGATLVFSLLLTWRMGYRRPRMLLASIGTGFATVLFFKTMLSVKIPGGMVYEYLPNAWRSFMILNF
ncbi:MAG: tripartite tricarboxylate transporter TctB family protein [Rhodobacteraceae bacterium]|nr:tripartite tricarboxylate transporter TctB family protein [Paracoccaceae bacterium]